jgi:hypothetical protein
MGFLNHATNNIIIDAVLTERGRELLANERFNVTSFAFGDDEIDYSLLEKYGTSIGKEKIMKNTPIWEALPNENIAMKSYLITYPNPTGNLTNMPKLVWSNKVSGQTRIDLSESNVSNSALSSAAVTIKNYVAALSSGETLSTIVTDRDFYVKVHNKLLEISGQDILDTDSNNISTYIIPSNVIRDASRQWDNQVISTFSISSKGIVTDSTFKNYSSILSPTKINTNVQIIGRQSGATLLIPVTITK